MKQKKEIIFSAMMLQLVAGGLAEDWIWKQMPLRSDEMKAAGLRGGAGFQQVYGLTFAPSDPSRVYASIDCAQVWRSDDGGWNWRRAAAGFRANGAMDLAVDPFDPDVVFAAGSQARFTSEEVDGVYRTLDGGDSWERVLPAIFNKLPIRRGGTLFWIDPDSRADGRCRVIYTSDQSGEGIFRTDDGGDTWGNIGIDGLGVVYDFQRNPFAPEFWVSTENGLFIIRDQGNGTYRKTAVEVGRRGLPEGADHLVSRIQFNPANRDVIYALCGKSGFYRSMDGGKTFVSSNRGIPAHILGRRFVSMLDMNPLNPDWLILSWFQTASGNFMSFDGGETWGPFQGMDSTGMTRHLDAEGNPNSFYIGHRAAFHPHDPRIALIPGHVWQMERTEDGGQSWQFSGNGFCGARVGVGRTSFAFPESRPEEITLFIIDYGPFRSTDGGETFRTLAPIRVDGARTAPAGAVHPDNPDIIICPSGHWNSQRLIFTEDGGESWHVALETKSNFRFCAFHPQQPEIIYAGEFRSDDGGATWNELSYPVADMDPGNGDLIYAFVSDAGKTRVYRSLNRGKHWEQVGPEIPSSGVHEIAVDHRNPDRIYVPAMAGLYIFDGMEWQLRDETNGLPRDWFGQYSLRNVVVDPRDSNVIYLSRLNSRIGQSDGILRSRDRGETWENITGNLGPEINIWAVGVDARNDRLYVGTSNGTWYLK